VGRTRKTTCERLHLSRADKKACDGNIEEGCERCRSRSISCVFPGSRAATSTRKPKGTRGSRRSSLVRPESNSSLRSEIASSRNAPSSTMEVTWTGSSGAIHQPKTQQPARDVSERPGSTGNISGLVPIFPRTVFLPGSSLPVKDDDDDADYSSDGVSMDEDSENWSPQDEAYSLVPLANPIVGTTSSDTPSLFAQPFGVMWDSAESTQNSYSDVDPWLSDSLSGNLSIPPHYSALDVPVPLAPGRNWIPDQSTILCFVDGYFTTADITMALLHRGAFHSSSPSTLLLCSILLVVPEFTYGTVGSEWTTARLAVWTRDLFQQIKDEMLAFLASDAPITAEIVAAVLNVRAFCFFKGLINLGRRLTALLGTLVTKMGMVKDAETLEPPDDLKTWKQTLEMVFGADVYTRIISPAELDQIQQLWIGYWSRERIVQNVISTFFAVKWGRSQILCLAVINLPFCFSRDWSRSLTPADFEASLGALARPMPPMPHVWQASIARTLDPRTLPDPPNCLEVLSPHGSR